MLWKKARVFLSVALPYSANQRQINSHSTAQCQKHLLSHTQEELWQRDAAEQNIYGVFCSVPITNLFHSPPLELCCYSSTRMWVQLIPLTNRKQHRKINAWILRVFGDLYSFLCTSFVSPNHKLMQAWKQWRGNTFGCWSHPFLARTSASISCQLWPWLHLFLCCHKLFFHPKTFGQVEIKNH